MPNTAIKTSQIQDDAVTFAKIENATAENILIGRGSGNGGGNYQAVTLGSGLTMSGTTLSSAAVVSDGDKGDITVSASGATWTIDNDAVTYAKMQNVSAASKLLGRGSASGSGDTQEITLGSGLTMSGTTLAASGGGPTFSAFKSVNETITNAATLNTDSALQILYLPDNKYYYLELDVMYTGNGNTVYFYFNSDVSNGFFNPTNSTTINLKINQNLPVSGSSSQTYIRITGIIQSNAFEPSIYLQWKQQFGGSLTVHAGSILRLYRLN